VGYDLVLSVFVFSGCLISLLQHYVSFRCFCMNSFFGFCVTYANNNGRYRVVAVAAADDVDITLYNQNRKDVLYFQCTHLVT